MTCPNCGSTRTITPYDDRIAEKYGELELEYECQDCGFRWDVEQ